MDKNTVKKLADNPHYAMNDKELEALAQLLEQEGQSQKDEEREVKVVEKNRVRKTKVALKKAPTLQEADDDLEG